MPKTRDLGGLTALQFAARQGSLQAVEKLLDAGADANAAEPHVSAHAAAARDRQRPLHACAKRLIERGVGVDDGSLYLAVDTRNLGFYAQRPNPPEKDGDVTNLDVIEAARARRESRLAVHERAFRRRSEPRLPERTVAGEIVVPPGATPLDRAAAASDFAVVETLLAHGASAKVVTEDGTTPLMLLAGYSRARGAPVTNDPKRLELIRALLEKGADVHAVHKDSTNNALFFAKSAARPRSSRCSTSSARARRRPETNASALRLSAPALGAGGSGRRW